MPAQVEKSRSSFVRYHPEATILLWKKKDLMEFVECFYPFLNKLFTKIPRTILKADLLRFLLLQQFGGVYADIDTLCLKPAYEWSNEDRNVSLITGYEASLRDDLNWLSNPTLPKPLAREVQLTTWTLASAPLHPLITRLLQGCLEILRNRTREELAAYDVMDFAGPGAWTDVVLEHIRYFGYTEDDIYHMKQPIRVGGVYILPAAGFRWESNGDKKLACVRHTFAGYWKNYHGQEEEEQGKEGFRTLMD